MPLNLATMSSRVRVNSNVVGDQTNAHLHVSSADDLLITWSGNNAAAFDASGAALSIPAGNWTGGANWLGDTRLIGQTFVALPDSPWSAAIYDGTTAVAGPSDIKPFQSYSFNPAFVEQLPNGDLVFLARVGSGGSEAAYMVTTTASLSVITYGILAGPQPLAVQDFDVLPDGNVIVQRGDFISIYAPTGNDPGTTYRPALASVLGKAFTVLDDGGFLAATYTYAVFYNHDGTTRGPAFTLTTSATASGLELIQVDSRLSLATWYDSAINETRGLLIENSGRVVSTAFSLGAGERHDFAALDTDTLVSIESTTNSGPGGSGLDIVKSEFSLDRANVQLGTGADEQFGGAGGQAMAGFGGNDWYFIDSADDYVVEVVGEGTADRIFTSVDYTLRADQEIETLTPDLYTGTTPLNLTGNAFAQTIYGNGGANNLTGGGGGDTLFGLGGNDNFFITGGVDSVREAAGGGSDRVASSTSWVMTAGQEIEKLQTAANLGTAAINFTGNAFSQAIYGNSGVNQLNGGGGGDTLVGMLGNDIYFVTDTRDNVVELAGQGNDVVYANVSWQLRAGQEVELMLLTTPGGTAALNLTGNELAQHITGNAGANILTSGGGGDVLEGLAGNDSYYVSAASDRTIEQTGGGQDHVYASLSYTLTSGQSIEQLSTTSDAGTGAISLTGNALAQTITGNAGANILNGGGGGDIMIGLGGNDTYYVLNASDQIQDGAAGGTDDRVYASVDYRLNAGAQVERMSTANHAGTEAIDLTGNALSQTIYGNAGDNVLNGGGGKDVLIGQGGDDKFFFDSALNTAFASSFASLASTANVARIDDMTIDDRIVLDHNVFGLTPGGLPQGAFALGTTATEADDRILWDSATGAILFDADGVGGAAAHLLAYISNPFNLDYTFIQVA